MNESCAGNQIKNQIIAHARDLLESKHVAIVIGYEKGSDDRTRPAFIRAPSDARRLVWNRGCTHNLVRYLRDRKIETKRDQPIPRVAIVVKACDSRALNVLFSERQIERENVHVIGVVCSGIVKGAGFAKPRRRQLQDRCLGCADRTPVLYDHLIGEPIAAVTQDKSVEETRLHAMTPEERLDYWLSQFDRCIRCNACRQACPGCYCSVCLCERDDALWVGIAPRAKEKGFFHLIRAFHLAGRCAGCDECERVCPMEIPLSSLNRKLAGAVEELFAYRAGMEPSPNPLLTMLAEGLESPI